LILATATGLISSLFNVASSQDVPFHQLQQLQCLHHGSNKAYLCSLLCSIPLFTTYVSFALLVDGKFLNNNIQVNFVLIPSEAGPELLLLKFCHQPIPSSQPFLGRPLWFFTLAILKRAAPFFFLQPGCF